MREQLPILEELKQTDTFAAMAGWLAACPLAIFASHGDGIVAIVRGRRFSSGCDYLDRFIRALHATRSGGFQEFRGELHGDETYAMQRQAEQLDQAAGLVAGLDLSWHESRRSGASHAG